MEALLPGVRVTRCRVLVLFAAGVLWANAVTLLKVAAALPLAAADPSTERRLKRFLTNPAVSVETLWQPLLPVLLRAVGNQELAIVFDPTPYRDRATILCLGLVVRHRVLPLLWRVVPQQEPWPAPLPPILREMLTTLNAALPAGCQVTLLADRGLVGPTLLDCAQAVGWHIVLRLRAGAGEETRIRLGDGPEQRLADLPSGPGQRYGGPAAIFKGAGWRSGYLTIHWNAAAKEPWVLFSDRPGGPDRVREYRRRVRTEATYQDEKGRGFGLERSKLVALDRIDRLVLAVHLALWWGYGLGLQVIRNGQRARFDRRDRRDLSVLRIGRTACLKTLDRDHLPALPFRHTALGWSFPWLR